MNFDENCTHFLAKFHDKLILNMKYGNVSLTAVCYLRLFGNQACTTQVNCHESRGRPIKSTQTLSTMRQRHKHPNKNTKLSRGRGLSLSFKFNQASCFHFILQHKHLCSLSSWKQTNKVTLSAPRIEKNEIRSWKRANEEMNGNYIVSTNLPSLSTP